MSDYLEARERWWQHTKNPLYIWEAIALTLNASPPVPIPDWCIPYLREAATRITNLSWAVSRGEVEANRAYRQVSVKLDLGRQGKKNAFSAMTEDAVSMHVASDKRVHADANVDLVKRRRRERQNISPERARAIARHGRKLIGDD